MQEEVAVKIQGTSQRQLSAQAVWKLKNGLM